MTLLQGIIDGLALGAVYAVVALGIGLVFGLMRLVNFAHGELFTAGAYALVLTRGQPTILRIAACIGAAVVLALLLERLAFRRLRDAPPARMLVTTFGVSFGLQSVALLWFGARGENAQFLPRLNRAIELTDDLRIRYITLVAVAVCSVLLGATWLILERTALGLQLRAAAADFTTARLLGVRASRVIPAAFLLAGTLAGIAALVLAVQRPLVTPTYGLPIVISGLVGVVVGGMDRLWTATLGGFAVGFATAVLGAVLPSDSRVFLTSLLFLLVIIVLLVRPNGVFVRARGALGERV